MTDRERIYWACLHPDWLYMLDELERDCLESRVIDQVLGLADLSGRVAEGLMDAIAAYPSARWSADERSIACDLANRAAWWLGLIEEFEDAPIPVGASVAAGADSGAKEASDGE